MSERWLPLKRKCLVAPGVFWRVEKYFGMQSQIVSVRMHSFCMCSERSAASLPYHYSWWALKLPINTEL